MIEANSASSSANEVSIRTRVSGLRARISRVASMPLAGIMFAPRVNRQNTVVFVGGRVTYGEPGFFRVVRTSGQPLFQVNLPDDPGFEPYGQLVPTSRPVFSPDGTTAYSVVDLAGDGNVPLADTYAYLYAISTTVTAPPPPGPPLPRRQPHRSAGERHSGRPVMGGQRIE